jgi:hypothetical protein
MTMGQCWRLAQAWYPDRLKPDWQRMTQAEMMQVFERVGLAGQFWRV